MNSLNRDMWSKEYSKIMLEWIESQWKIEQAHQAGEPYTRMKFEAEANRVETKLKDFIRTLLEEAKAEENKRCLEALPKPMEYVEIVADHRWTNKRKELYNQRKDAWNEYRDQAISAISNKK